VSKNLAWTSQVGSLVPQRQPSLRMAAVFLCRVGTVFLKKGELDRELTYNRQQLFWRS